MCCSLCQEMADLFGCVTCLVVEYVNKISLDNKWKINDILGERITKSGRKYKVAQKPTQVYKSGLSNSRLSQVHSFSKVTKVKGRVAVQKGRGQQLGRIFVLRLVVVLLLVEVTISDTTLYTLENKRNWVASAQLWCLHFLLLQYIHTLCCGKPTVSKGLPHRQ